MGKSLNIKDVNVQLNTKPLEFDCLSGTLIVLTMRMAKRIILTNWKHDIIPDAKERLLEICDLL